MLLVDIGELHGITDDDFPAVGFLKTHYEAEESCLSGSVGADYSDKAGPRKHEIQMFE